MIYAKLMALPSWLLVPVGGKRFQCPGPSPTLGTLGHFHHWRHKSRVSLRGPPCAHGVSGIIYGEVRDTFLCSDNFHPCHSYGTDHHSLLTAHRSYGSISPLTRYGKIFKANEKVISWPLFFPPPMALSMWPKQYSSLWSPLIISTLLCGKIYF
jgi:hypothetical protein